MYTGKLGVGLIAFNRPHYFRETIKSLNKQTHLADTDFHLFQDGRLNKFSKKLHADRIVVAKSLDLFRRAKLPNKTEHIQKQNVGNGINQFMAVEHLASKYDYFLIIEDDVVLSPHYLRLIRLMISQFMGIDDVFSVSLSFKRKCEKSEIGENLDKVAYLHEHWWAECWSAAKWKTCRKHFLTYYQFIQNCDYQLRPHDKIRRMFHSQGFMVPQTSQDAGKDFMLFKTGMHRLNTVVNRGFYIGEQGMHFRASTYKRMGFGEMKPYIHEEDAKLDSFVLDSSIG
jgi:hypothetical protein